MRNLFLPFLVVILVVLYASVFVVQEGSRGLVLRFGKVQRDSSDQAVIYEPGLHFKVPFLDNVKILDKRIQTMENPADRFMTNETKELIVDSYMKWRIVDFNQFYISTRGGNMTYAENLLKNRLSDRLRSEIGCKDIRDIVSDSRGALMAKVLNALNGRYDEVSIQCTPRVVSTISSDPVAAATVGAVIDPAAKVVEEVVIESAMTPEEEEKARQAAIAASSVAGLGIEVVDVRIKQINLPPEVSKDIYNRMRVERGAVAQRHRAQGQEQAEKNRAAADYLVTRTIAEAERESRVIRGEGDAEAARLFAESFSKDINFYNFIRSLKAYENSFNGDGDVMVLSPDSEFFRYMESPKASDKR